MVNVMALWVWQVQLELVSCVWALSADGKAHQQMHWFLLNSMHCITGPLHCIIVPARTDVSTLALLWLAPISALCTCSRFGIVIHYQLQACCNAGSGNALRQGHLYKALHLPVEV